MKHLILADVHANLPALEAVLEAEHDVDEVLFLGDAVVGGPQPEQTVGLLRRLGGVAIMGNHDRQVLTATYGPDEPNLSHRWVRWTQQQLSPASWAYLRSMDDSRAIRRHRWHMRLHHGDFPAPAGRFWPDWPQEKRDWLVGRFAEPVIIAGHSHVQFQLEHRGRLLVNPGAVGQPRLGQPLALYAVLEQDELSLRAVPYDVERTCRAMDDVPLPEPFVRMWKQIYRDGMLSDHYPIREWQSLRDAGYR